MSNNFNNVILFPKWKTNLQEESLEALRQKNYKTALQKLNKLLHYNVNSHEVIFGKLICLVELGYLVEAQDLCEEQLSKKGPNYYDYIHLYLTILFQTEQYQLLNEKINDELKYDRLPDELRNQFQQLLQLSTQMYNDTIVKEALDQEKKLHTAFENKDDFEQWQIIQQLQKLNHSPSNDIINLLREEEVHPVIKTAIFMWLQHANINKEVTVTKFNLHKIVNPTLISPLLEHHIYKTGLALIHEKEQKNPTLIHLLERLLYRYLFIRFPIMPPSEEMVEVVEAMKQIGEQTLHNSVKDHIHSNVKKYIDEVHLCETLYLSIIEE